ncbi:50S ribosomal protein L24 [Candidatus Roizmanbacteria bacterium RIFCSPHIGHO2_02_FULL_37_13b]|uniref:Large ribosomal subunit protein uL24 n=1 Tax=Candidatus Roizmanbacteria bacterium RIFCSPLOWO2_02_FULL_36_11 TaxID=1802071 RepID=A0A1F7JCL6_9BACT|nr:MAG: 50S ribosomal protein L24 [Candidatus Roizmanbacteria bacterium RIFCSPHIGHO2_02_FULL_37_13b]OGK53325.1 MAG: 50S ribosomal protein L24 [Candidatus Roizmanbacteria bacterium RIFCSPLOWO2_02_FULL_36_11]
MKFKKGDKIRVFVGKDKGREGKIEKVYSKMSKVLIVGINIYKKHIKKNEKMPKGGIVELPRPMDVSKLMFICPKCKADVKLGYKFIGQKKLRICRKCAAEV